MSGSDGVTLADNHVANTDNEALRLESSSRSVVRGNALVENTYALDLASVNSTTVEANRVTDTGVGILLSNSDDNAVTDNRFNGTTGSDDYAIRLVGSDRTVVANNSIQPTGFYPFLYAIDLEDGNAGTLVRNNTIHENGQSVRVRNSRGSVIEDNDIDGYDSSSSFVSRHKGIFLDNATDTAVRTNDVTDTDNEGVEILDSDNSTVRANDVTASEEDGLAVGRSANVTVANNVLEDNSGGGILLDGANGTAAVRNNTVRNNGGVGLRVGHHEDLLVRNNTLVANRVAVVEPTVTLVDIEVSDASIDVRGTRDVTVRESSVRNSPDAGVDVVGSTGVTVRNTTVRRSAYGVRLAGSSGNRLVDVTAANNTWTVYAEPGPGGSASRNVHADGLTVAFPDGQRTLSFTATDVGLGVADRPSPPDPYHAVGPALRARNTSNGTAAWLDVTLPYNGTTVDENDLNESTVRLWRNDTDWSAVEDRRLDTTTDHVGANVTATFDGSDATLAPLAKPPNVAPDLRASLTSTTNNVGAPLVVRVNATDTDGNITGVELVLASGQSTNLSVEAGHVDRNVSVVPGNDTWNGSGYESTNVTVRVTDDQAATVTTTLSTPVYTAGDADGDGAVDIFDAVAVGSAWKAQRGDDAYDDDADLNNDGVVNIFDAVVIGNNWDDEA